MTATPTTVTPAITPARQTHRTLWRLTAASSASPIRSPSPVADLPAEVAANQPRRKQKVARHRSRMIPRKSAVSTPDRRTHAPDHPHRGRSFPPQPDDGPLRPQQQPRLTETTEIVQEIQAVASAPRVEKRTEKVYGLWEQGGRRHRQKSNAAALASGVIEAGYTEVEKRNRRIGLAALVVTAVVALSWVALTV